MPKTILIVDDDALFRQAIGDGLRASGYRVLLAGDGLEALDRVRAAPPDFILLDLIMPNLDGFRLCKLLKGDPQHRGIPIIVLTGLGREGLKNLADLGAEAAVAKRDATATLAELRKTLHLLGAVRLRRTPFIDPAPDLPERRIVGELLADRHHTDTVLAHLGEGVVELDDHGQVLFLNPAALRILNTTEAAVLGTSGGHLLGAPNASRLQQAVREAQARGGGPPVHLDLPRGQQGIALTLTAVPRPDASPGVLLLLRDLADDTRRARACQALVAAAQQILAPLDLATIVREVVARAAALLGTARCALFHLEGSGPPQRLRCVQAVGLSEACIGAQAPVPGAAVAGQAIAQRRPIFTADLPPEAMPRSSPALCPGLEAEEIGGVLAVPIATARETIGALAVYRAAGHQFASAEADLLAGLAGFAGIAIEHAERFAQAARSAAQPERMLENPPQDAGP